MVLLETRQTARSSTLYSQENGSARSSIQEKRKRGCEVLNTSVVLCMCLHALHCMNNVVKMMILRYNAEKFSASGGACGGL